MNTIMPGHLELTEGAASPSDLSTASWTSLLVGAAPEWNTSEPVMYANSSHWLDDPELIEGAARGDTSLSPVYMTFHFCVRFVESVLALLGNLLTLVAVGRYAALQSCTNVLVCSLAVADLLAAFLLPLNVAHQRLAGRPAYVPLCLAEQMISSASSRCNLFSVFLIAVDRFLYIVRPLSYPRLVTWPRVIGVVGFIWATVVVDSPLVFSLGHGLTVGMRCKYCFFMPDFCTIYIVPVFVIFISFTIVLYAAIARTALRQGNAIEDSMASRTAGEVVSSTILKRKELKIVKMMFLVIGIYLLTTVPQVVVALTHPTKASVFRRTLEKVTTLFFWTNSWVNPFIYAWQSQPFRTAFRRILHLGTPAVTSHPLNSVTGASIPT